MAKTEEIIEKFEQYRAAQKPVRMLNVYKGIPIQNEATIVDSLSHGSYVFAVNKYQATCLELQRQTYIQCDDLANVVRASVVGVDFLQETSQLTAFIYMESDIGHRLLVRVQPKEPIMVDISIKGRSLTGKLADLSVSGFGLYTGAIIYGPAFFSANTHVTLSLLLPNAKGPLRMSGTIINVRRERSAYRLGIGLMPDNNAKVVLTQYVSQRQAEIQRDLRMMHEMFYQLASGGKK